jgi:hypothetical protein
MRLPPFGNEKMYLGPERQQPENGLFSVNQRETLCLLVDGISLEIRNYKESCCCCSSIHRFLFIIKHPLRYNRDSD